MKPILVKTVHEMSELSRDYQGSVGFVPTMGYLHEGHLSLVKTSQSQNDITIVSIYVNPSQFGPQEDLEAYPRDLDWDIDLLADLKVDYVFFPNNEEIYPQNYKTWVEVEKITSILCGKSRPEHFKGVTTIVCKLLNIVQPDSIYLGEKDFQQLMVIKTMVRDLNMQVEVKGCPIIREKDGLAMSSRNKYLLGADRQRALCLFNSLQKAQNSFSAGERNIKTVLTQMEEIILKQKGLIDYIEFIDPDTFDPADQLCKGCRIILAVNISNTRLIDNWQLI